MKYLIAFLFPNWKVIIHEQVQQPFDIVTDKGVSHRTHHICNYYIEYSELRKAYRLKMDGYNPKEHLYYSTIMARLIKLNKL